MRSLFLTALAVVVPAAPSLAAAPAPWEGAPFSAPAAELARAAAALPVPQDAYAELLLEETHVSFDAAGVESYRFRRVYRVLSQEAARGWGRVDMPWSPWHQERPQIRARVINRDGQEHVLDPATLVEAGDDEHTEDTFSDRRALRGPLPAVAEGSLVELELSVQGKDSLFSAGTSGLLSLDDRMPLRKVRVVLEAPRALPLRAEVRGLKLTPRREERDGRVRLTWEAGPLAARADEEPFLPPELTQGAELLYATGRDWQTLAQRYHQVVEAQLAGADLAAQAAEAAGTETRPERVAARVMAWVHARVRYTGLHAGAAAVVPRPPGETLSRRFGDCKDLATLVVGLLRARGIPAQVALLRVGDEEVDPAFPGLGRFDHAIVHVPGPSALWVDATDPFTPVGELNLGVQGRLALVAAPQTRALVRLPEARPAANTLRITRTLLLAEDGPARVREATDATGTDRRALPPALRLHASGAPQGGLRALREERPAGRHARGRGAPARAHPRRAALPPGPGRERLEARGDGRHPGRGAHLPLPGPHPHAGHAARPDGRGRGRGRRGREAPAAQPRPAAARGLRGGAHLPGGAARGLPRGLAAGRARGGAGAGEAALALRAAGPARCSRASASTRRSAATAPRRWRPSAPRWRCSARRRPRGSSCRARRTRSSPRARCARGSSSCARAPPTTPPRRCTGCQLAEALLKLGMGEDARAEAQAAVRLEPKSALAQRTLARTLMHDALGRELQPGFDGPGAIAALRRARALEPKEPLARLMLARHALARPRRRRALQRGGAAPRGHRRVPGAAHRAGQEGLGRGAARGALEGGALQGLPGARRQGRGARSPDALAARAALEGVPAALREAQARLSDPDERKRTLAVAAVRLMGLRRYEEVRALPARVGPRRRRRPAAGAAGGDGEGGGRLEPKDLPTDDPQNVVRRLMLAAAEPAVFEVRPLFSRATLDKDEEAEKGFLAGARSGLRGVEKPAAGLTLRAAMELGLALIELKSDGDARTGVRVRVPQMVAGTGEQSFFLVKEGGAWRVRAVAPGLGTLGVEALARLDAGDLAGARQWLDWARELLPQLVAEDRPRTLRACLAARRRHPGRTRARAHGGGFARRPRWEEPPAAHLPRAGARPRRQRGGARAARPRPGLRLPGERGRAPAARDGGPAARRPPRRRERLPADRLRAHAAAALRRARAAGPGAARAAPG